MRSCTKRLHFHAGHRVLGHEGSCRYLHGHTYLAEITCSASLNELGMVIDFGKIKELVGGWIDDHLDHNLILCDKDPVIPYLTKEERLPFIMGTNPTAENLAEMLYWKARDLLKVESIKVTHVRVWETSTSWADFNER